MIIFQKPHVESIWGPNFKIWVQGYINEYFDKLEQWKSVTGLRLSRFGVCDFLVLVILDCLDLECQLLVLYRFNSISKNLSYFRNFTGCQANYCSRSLRIVYKIFIKTFKYDKFTKKSQKNV